VAIASFDLFQESSIIARVARLEAQLRRGLTPLLRLPVVGDVRVLGGVAAIELVTDKASKDAGGYLDQIGPRLSSTFVERGLLLRPLGNILYFMPPYVITDDEVDWVIGQIGSVLETI
jgi:adenosylmethionine-8-amino-7-oxononanoate aminotransferase